MIIIVIIMIIIRLGALWWCVNEAKIDPLFMTRFQGNQRGRRKLLKVCGMLLFGCSRLSCIIIFYYTASSVCGQDESYPALWLATRAGKVELSCPLGTTAVFRTKFFPKSHIINPLLTKFVWSRWLEIGLVLFLRVYGPRLRLGP